MILPRNKPLISILVFLIMVHTNRMKVVEKEEGNSPDFKEGTVSDWSEELVYTQPASISTPQNLHWKEGVTGVLEWDAVEKAAAYRVALSSQE